MISTTTHDAWGPPREPAARPAVSWFIAIYVVLAFGWWGEAVRALAVPGAAGPARMIPWFAAITLAARVLAWAGESGFYVMWWRAWGRRLPFWLCLRWAVACSGASLLALSLARTAGDHPGAAPWFAVLAGPAALDPAPSPWLAFGDAGLLTAARIGFTAEIHARALGVPRRVTLAVCAGAWLVSRLVLLAVADLGHGRSPWS
jgi:hypothetical protein